MITNHGKKTMMNYLLGQQTVNIPNIYIGVSKSDIGADGTGIVEPTGGNYKRKQIPNNLVTWSVCADGMVTNNQMIEFEESTAIWGTDMPAIFLSDSLTGGQVLFYDRLEIPVDVKAYTVLRFKAGQIKFRLVDAI